MAFNVQHSQETHYLSLRLVLTTIGYKHNRQVLGLMKQEITATEN